jgi:hypothetical protein
MRIDMTCIIGTRIRPDLSVFSWARRLNDSKCSGPSQGEAITELNGELLHDAAPIVG